MGKTILHALAACAAIALSSCGGGADPAGSLPERSVAPQALAAAQVPPALDATGLMDWAEGFFPGLFPGHQTNQALGPFVIRHYSNGNYLGLLGNTIYVLGPVTGNVPIAVGTLGQFTCLARPQNCTAAGSRVSGTVMGKGTPVPGAAVTLRDIAGNARSTIASAAGAYTLDASNLAPPFVVTASGAGSGGVPLNMVSVGRIGGGLQNARINVTPWTTALAAMVSSSGRATDVDPVRDLSSINGTLTVVISYSVTLLAPSLTDAGISPTGFDPISSPLDAGDAMSRILNDLTVGTTPTNAIIMASSSSAPCKTAAQLGSCVRYSDPGTQTTTNPNVCGSDIATGAPIPCDSSLPLDVVPPPISINLNQAYNFGCSGCVFWGPADNYAAPPTQTPLHLTVVIATWYAHFSATACVDGAGCFSSSVTTGITGETFQAQATCQEAAQTVLGILASAAIPGLSYSFTCTQSP